jgi:Phosphotransferase enzyme family
MEDALPSPAPGVIPEKVRNKQLRRVDWRFLLPSPHFQKTLCFGGKKLTKAIESISSCVADPKSSPHDCDLAVAIDPNAKKLHSAWRGLTPGGYLYAEWYGPWPAGAPRIRRLIQSVGFEAIACYWAWPLPSRSKARFWIDLGSRGALQHFLSTRPHPRTWIRRAGSIVLRSCWRMALRVGVTLPICAVARKPVRADPAPSAGSLIAVSRGAGPTFLADLCQRWPEWNLGPTPARLSWSLITAGESSGNKIVGLAFAEPESRPVMAVKMPRIPTSAQSLYREAANLRAVHAQHSGGVPGVPRALLCEEMQGVLVLAETALTGIPLLYALRRSTYQRYAMKVMDWLAALARSNSRSPRSEWWGRIVAPVLRDFENQFGAVVDPVMLRESRDILSDLDDVPRVCEQRDFSPWNVLLGADGSLVILDWESAEIDGLAGLDAIYFLTFAGFFLDGAMESHRFRKSYRAMLDPATFSGRIASECMQFYAKQAGISPSLFHALRILTWMLHSRSDHQHIASHAGPRPLNPEKLRRSMCVQLWEDEIRNGG